MTTHNALEGMVAVSADSEVEKLGHVVWFSVPDEPTNLNRLRIEWLAKKLDERVLPPEPRPLYVFKRAMREQEGKVRNTDGSVTETDVRLVSEDHDLCIYQISRVVRDQTKKVINYPKAMRVTFDKGDANAKRPFDFDPLDEVPAEDVLPMMHAITDYFNHSTLAIDGRKVRALVRGFLSDDTDDAKEIVGLSGLNLRGKAGGVYFVADEHTNKLKAIAKVLDKLYPDGRAYLYMVPLADDAEAKELVRQRHIANSVKEAQDAITEVGELLAERTTPVRSDVREHHWRRLQLARERASEYAEILGGEVKEVDQALELVKTQLERLV